MSEGFADFPASLFLQNAASTRSSKESLNFWEDERKSIIEKNQTGFRALDLGPGHHGTQAKTIATLV